MMCRKIEEGELGEGEWTGPKLLYMAGLFDVWNKGEEGPVYNYTIITTAANKGGCQPTSRSVLTQ